MVNKVIIILIIIIIIITIIIIGLMLQMSATHQTLQPKNITHYCFMVIKTYCKFSLLKKNPVYMYVKTSLPGELFTSIHVDNYSLLREVSTFEKLVSSRQNYGCEDIIG